MSRAFKQIIESYRLTFIFIISALPLFCLPIFFEGLQHIAEVKLGMFAASGLEDFSDEAQKKRIFFGFFKVLSIVAIVILLPRFFIHNRNLKQTLQFSPKAARAVIIGFLFMVFIGLWMFFLGPWVMDMVMDMVMEGASKKQKSLLPLLAVLMMGFPLQKHYNNWMAAVFDDAPISKQENKNLNKAMMGGMAPAIIVVIVPFMVIHSLLNMKAMGQALPTLWGLLTLDSLVVGLLAALMGAALYVIYRDARLNT